ncbi:MAG TPA: hypothetical protein VFM06_03415 [Candidatus Limnocylindria bacterium]|nr:hypothetical protein [Candidatus Limnocylindria bacterium]
MNSILRYLREQAKNYDCSVCGTSHGRSAINVLGKRDGGWVVRVVCSKCDTSITLLVYVADREGATVSPLPRQRKPARSPVTLDEVLDAHELLESFTGDVRDLFAQRGKVSSPTDAS